jgi:hypothetical protein
MSKNLYRVCKKSDLDEIIKNNFFKPICIIFTTKDTDKEFEDNIANLFKTLAKQNTYCMHLLINLDNFIDNINFFGGMRINSPNFITYFKGKQISSFINSQNNKEIFLSSTNEIINKIHASYIQKLVNSFNEDNKTNQNEDNQNMKENNKENNNDEEYNEEKADEADEADDADDADEADDADDADEADDDEADDDDDDKPVNNIKKRNTETSDMKVEEKVEEKVNKKEKVDISKLDISKVDISKIDISKIDLRKIDLEQLSIDKKKEKLKELLELKKRAQKS